MITEIELFEYPGFCLRGWMKSHVYRTKVDTRGELLAGVLDAVASIKKREYQLRRKTRDLRTEVDGGIFGSLL